MRAIEDLLQTMRALLDADSGCDWVRAQTMATILPYTLEETYELLAAVESEEAAAVRDELADLLYHIVYYSELAARRGWFDFAELARHARDKQVRRHPHVFAGAAAPQPGPAAGSCWERRKLEQRPAGAEGLLGGVSLAQPALIAAAKLQKRAAAAGFDWPEAGPVLDKVGEELEEIRAELEAGAGNERLAEEVGDLLFACVNVARHAGVEPETALRRTNRKFLRRFGYIEARLRAQGRTLDEATLEEMDTLWEESKGGEE
jgi:ATP diphosphatase